MPYFLRANLNPSQKVSKSIEIHINVLKRKMVEIHKHLSALTSLERPTSLTNYDKKCIGYTHTVVLLIYLPSDRFLIAFGSELEFVVVSRRCLQLHDFDGQSGSFPSRISPLQIETSAMNQTPAIDSRALKCKQCL